MKGLWDEFKEIAAGAFLIASLGWVLFHLILIKLQGVVRITETNQWVLWIEIVIISGLILLGIERLRDDWRNRK